MVLESKNINRNINLAKGIQDLFQSVSKLSYELMNGSDLSVERLYTDIKKLVTIYDARNRVAKNMYIRS